MLVRLLLTLLVIILDLAMDIILLILLRLVNFHLLKYSKLVGLLLIRFLNKNCYILPSIKLINKLHIRLLSIQAIKYFLKLLLHIYFELHLLEILDYFQQFFESNKFKVLLQQVMKAYLQ